MIRKYRYRVCDCEHPGDYEPYLSAIRSGGGTIESIDWPGSGEDAVIHFTADPRAIEPIKNNLQELL